MIGKKTKKVVGEGQILRETNTHRIIFSLDPNAVVLVVGINKAGNFLYPMKKWRLGELSGIHAHTRHALIVRSALWFPPPYPSRYLYFFPLKFSHQTPPPFPTRTLKEGVAFSFTFLFGLDFHYIRCFLGWTNTW